MLVDRYFLYIDILGFAKMVETEPDRVVDLYEIISQLNAHRHESFGTIVFSDTILVYPKFQRGIDAREDSYFVMYLCEFAQDLLYRLANRDIHFRAVITQGKFAHYFLENVPCFYGPALINAYRTEKRIEAVGLFIDKRCDKKNRIYQTITFDEKYDFVFLMQRLEEFEPHGHLSFPYPDVWQLEQSGAQWQLAQDCLILRNSYFARQHSDPKVRAKHDRTWQLYAQRYPQIVGALIAQSFNPRAICGLFDWSEAVEFATNQ